MNGLLMTILVSGGDSFTFGNELADCTPTLFSNSTWASQLANKLDMSYDCTAWGGDGNSAIARKTMTACNNHIKQENTIVVAVMWSFTNRYEFRFNYNTKQRHSPWYTITPWTHEGNSNVIVNAYKNFKDTMFTDYKKNQETAESTGVADFSRTFFKHVGESDYWCLYTYIKEMVFLQDWLKIRNIPYVFTCVDNWAFETHKKDNTLGTLYDSLDMDNVISSQGFYSWAQAEEYTFGATHPLEEAHTAYALKILPFVERRLK